MVNAEQIIPIGSLVHAFLNGAAMLNCTGRLQRDKQNKSYTVVKANHVTLSMDICLIMVVVCIGTWFHI